LENVCRYNAALVNVDNDNIDTIYLIRKSIIYSASGEPI